MENSSTEVEEKWREAAANGDLEELQRLVSAGVDINSQNSINGWSALHWSAKRNHASVVGYLLSQGANASLKNNNGDLPAQLTTDPQIQQQLGANGPIEVKQSNLPIVPNYLANPVFPYSKDSQQSGGMNHTLTPRPAQHIPVREQELVLKARLANSDERDFIEVELSRDTLTYEALLRLLCRELGVDKRMVYKLRKLPDTIVRKDKDVKRLVDFQEVEIVLSNKVISASSRNYGIVGGSMPRQEQILY